MRWGIWPTRDCLLAADINSIQVVACCTCQSQGFVRLHQRRSKASEVFEVIGADWANRRRPAGQSAKVCRERPVNKGAENKNRLDDSNVHRPSSLLPPLG